MLGALAVPLPCARLPKSRVFLYVNSSLCLLLTVPAASPFWGKAGQKPTPLKPEIFPSAA